MSQVFLIEGVTDFGELERRLASLRPDVDRWATTSDLGDPKRPVERLVGSALGRARDYRSWAGYRDPLRGISRWVGRVIDHLVVLRPASTVVVERVIKMVGEADVDLWLVQPSRGVSLPRRVRRVDEGFLIGSLPRMPPPECDDELYAAHFLEYAAKVKRAPTAPWARHKEIARRGREAALEAAQANIWWRHLYPSDAFADLFVEPMHPVEALARLRGLQVEAFCRRWLIEQDDYRDTRALVARMAAGHATLDRGDTCIRVFSLGARDVLVTNHATIWGVDT